MPFIPYAWRPPCRLVVVQTPTDFRPQAPCCLPLSKINVEVHLKTHSVATVFTEPCTTKTFEQKLSPVPAWASWPHAPAPPPCSCSWSQPAQRKSFGFGSAFPSPAWRAANAPALDAGLLSATLRERTDEQRYIMPLQYFVGVWASMISVREIRVKERKESEQ